MNSGQRELVGTDLCACPVVASHSLGSPDPAGWLCWLWSTQTLLLNKGRRFSDFVLREEKKLTSLWVVQRLIWIQTINCTACSNTSLLMLRGLSYKELWNLFLPWAFACKSGIVFCCMYKLVPSPSSHISTWHSSGYQRFCTESQPATTQTCIALSLLLKLLFSNLLLSPL